MNYLRITHVIPFNYLDVPDVGQVMVFSKDKILNAREVVKELVSRNDKLRMSIPTLFLPMMKCLLIKLEDVFMPGFSAITWTSLNIPHFCERAIEILDYIELFVKEVSNLSN